MINNDTLKTIKERRSVRSFRSEQIMQEELDAVLEAAQYAPNAGDQAWHFTVVQNRELLSKLNGAAKEAVKLLNITSLMELANDKAYDCIYGAPTLVIVSGNEQSPIPLDSDCAAATQNLLLAAESIGLGSCWIFFAILAFFGPQGPQLRAELKLPDGYKPYTTAALGYKKDTASSPAPDRKPNLITHIT